MHAALEWFLATLAERDAAPQATLFGDAPAKRAGLSVTRDELFAKYDEVWLDEWYESREDKETHRAKGKAMLDLFYDQCAAEPPRPKFLEKEFSLKIGQYAVKGTIDRIDEAEGGVEIVDYKTGRPKTEDSLDADGKKQLQLYQIAVTRLFGLVPVKLTYHYLENGTKVSFLGTEKQLGKLEAEAEAAFSRIKAGDFAPTPGRHCGFCDFKEICEFRA
jgi:RecB family exonuclease